MRVTIDARPAVDREKTGVGYYAWNLIRRLPEIDAATTYVAWYAPKTLLERRRHFHDVGLPNFRERRIPLPSPVLARTARFGFPRVEWFGGFDVLFAPNFLPPPTRAKRIVVTVHDLAFRLFPETAPQALGWWRVALARTVKRATRIIVPSESTKRDLLELYGVHPESVAVTPLAVDPEVFKPPRDDQVLAVRRKFGIEGPYLLVMGRGPRKNVPRLIEAFAALPEDIRPSLVVSGIPVPRAKDSDPDLVALESLPRGVREGVFLIGYVSETEKVALLGGATGLAYPSLHEGFGFPVLEAMACGTPVLTSDVSSLAELFGDTAVLVDPYDVDAIREGLLSLLSDDILRSRLRAAGMVLAAGFDWTKTASMTAAVLREAAET